MGQGPGQFSEDKQWWWDGEKWLPADQAASQPLLTPEPVPEAEAQAPKGNWLSQSYKRVQQAASAESVRHEERQADAANVKAERKAKARIPLEALPLQEQIQRYQAAGYRVISQTEAAAQMVKPKTFSLGWFLIGTLFCGVPGIIYFAVYLAKKDQTAYLVAPPVVPPSA